MPTLEVKPNISLAYLDGGSPDPSNEDYMTIFVLHGNTCYTPFFKPAIAVSSKYNIRLVAITRRDYPGSSLLTDEDIKAAVDGPTEKRLQALKERGEEILLFIDQFITVNKIPSIGSNGGGFSLLAWSLRNVHGLSALAFANDFPDLVERLTPYFRSYILYGRSLLYQEIPICLSCIRVGHVLPVLSGAYHPLLDELRPKEERGPSFLDWISSHFIHPSEGLASGDIRLLNQKNPDASRPSVVSQLTAEERAMMLDFEPPLRADLFYYRLDQAVNEGILQRSFIQQDSQTFIAWPNVPVKSLFGDQSVWLILFGQRELEKWMKIQQSNAKENGRWVRTFESTCISEINAEFIKFQYEEPDGFVKAAKRLML